MTKGKKIVLGDFWSVDEMKDGVAKRNDDRVLLIRFYMRYKLIIANTINQNHNKKKVSIYEDNPGNILQDMKLIIL